MGFEEFFPIWDKLDALQQKRIQSTVISKTYAKGTLVHNGNMDCTGLVLVKSGQLRAYMISEEGREITLYRLFPNDVCLMSASCMMSSIQFEITIQAEKDTQAYVVPTDVYKSLMNTSIHVANYTSSLMGERFSEVMWLIEQILWKKMDSRVATFLLTESSIEKTNCLKVTHESIANHLGTHREVVTRLLKYFQEEGLVELSRGTILLTDCDALEDLSE